MESEVRKETTRRRWSSLGGDERVDEQRREERWEKERVEGRGEQWKVHGRKGKENRR